MQSTSASLKYRNSTCGAEIALPDVISALTFALDLTEAAAPGHALRCCLMGMRLAEAIGLPRSMMRSLYYALLLKDAGCSSNAAKMTSIAGGDDRRVKYTAKLADWTKPYRVDVRTVLALWRDVLPTRHGGRRAARLVRMAFEQRHNNRVMIELRCERGAEIVRKLEMDEEAAAAVRLLDEHWDGSGYPEGRRGSGIPVLARICAVAQTLDVFATVDGESRAIEVLRQRSGTWFDPELASAAASLHASGNLWRFCAPGEPANETRRAVLAIHPGERTLLPPGRIDRVCEAFASVVDAKSPFTYMHSVRVADVATGMAQQLGFSADRIQTVRRAGLLHDLGKLCVPNTILDKRGTLTPEEWAVIRKHPAMTRSILERIEAFEEIAVLASEHHERMDGSGYPYGLKGAEVSLESRLIAMADKYVGMTEERSYQKVFTKKETLAAIERDCVQDKMDAACYAALQCHLGTRSTWRSAECRRPGASHSDNEDVAGAGLPGGVSLALSAMEMR